ncbi:MAG: murein hydrolase activator EnvC family protein [Pseudomonadota bacterium]
MPLRLIAALAALLALPGAATAATADTGRAEAEAELERVTERLNELDVWLDSAERKRARWQREIREHDRQVSRLSREVDAAADALDAVRDELERLGDERERLEARRREQAQRIADHLASAHRMSGADFLKQLLNQESPARLQRMIRYHGYFTAARLDAAEAYQRTLGRLDANREELATRKAEAERHRETLRAEQAALVEQREERRALLERLAAEADSKAAERERLARDRERLESLLAELSRRARELDGRAFVESKGALPWPLEGRVLNAFGQSRAEGRMIWHGLLVEADQGAPVTAVFRGRVVFADWLRGFGLLTIVDHGSGYMTLYGHADVLEKAVGDWVEGGEVIARAGSSGGVSSTGLYFEVRHEGQAADPIMWLEAR